MRQAAKHTFVVGTEAIGKISWWESPAPVPPHQGHQLVEARDAPGKGFGLLVFTEITQILRDVIDSEFLTDPDPKIPIHRIVQLFVQKGNMIEDLASEESRLLENIIPQIDKLPQIERLCIWKPPLHPALLVDKIPLPIHHHRLWVGLEMLHNFTDRSWEVGIIRVQPGQDLALGHSEALVDGMRLAPIRLGDPGEPPLILFEDVQGVVG